MYDLVRHTFLYTCIPTCSITYTAAVDILTHAREKTEFQFEPKVSLNCIILHVYIVYSHMCTVTSYTLGYMHSINVPCVVVL